jgi:hypothetical protein
MEKRTGKMFRQRDSYSVADQSRVKKSVAKDREEDEEAEQEDVALNSVGLGKAPARV